MLFFQCLLYNFRLLFLQVIVFGQVMIENRYIQVFVFCKFIHSVVSLVGDVVVQLFFKVACAISPLFACHKVVAVVIHVLLYKVVNQFCLAT